MSPDDGRPDRLLRHHHHQSTKRVASMATAAVAAASAQAPAKDQVPASRVSRPLRTLNNIHSAPHVIQPHPDNSPNLSGKRKTAVELLEESKALYVKTERVLDRKQEQPHFAAHAADRLLQHHPNRSPMLSLPSAKIRDHFVIGGDGPPNGQQRVRQRDGYFTTPPVEKRRLSIRKDNPIPLNVTAVKRFLSRPMSGGGSGGGNGGAGGAGDESVQLRKVVPSKSASRLIGFFESKGGSSSASSGPDGPSSSAKKPTRSRITFSEVLPCICQQSSRPPELPHRNRPSPPPPPIPPKSPALNAKLRLLREQEQQLRRVADLPPEQPPPPPPPPPADVKEAPVFRRIQSEEVAPVGGLVVVVAVQPQVAPHQQRSLMRHPVLHKSLPDLNSPKNVRRRATGGKIRSASTDLDSCSGASDTSSRMSRNSSVNIDTSSSSDEASNESETPFCRSGGDGGGNGGASSTAARASITASRSERATTSDYASRSPSFKYETSSLVQTSHIWSLPPWQDDSVAGDSPIVEQPTRPDAVTRRKAILRSKSDVGPSRFAPDLLPAVPAEFTGDVPLDLDRFFDTIGHQEAEWCAAAAAERTSDGRSGRSSPVYFPSVSSVDSCCRRRVNADNAYESSDSDDAAVILQRRLLGSQPGMGEPSIVERNARIIKWLIKCRSVPTSSSAAVTVIPASGSTGHLSKLAAATPHRLPRSNTHIPKQSPVSYYGQSTRL